jgi:tRNA dimethylallyltransferase
MNRLTRDEMVQKLEVEIHRFAKRQMTWFRGMERRALQLTG